MLTRLHVWHMTRHDASAPVCAWLDVIHGVQHMEGLGHEICRCMVVCLGVCECDRSHDSMSRLEERGCALDVAGAAYCFYLSYLISTYLLVYICLFLCVLSTMMAFLLRAGAEVFAPRWAAGVNQSLLCRAAL